MKKYLTAATAGLIMSAAVALCAAPSALAHDRVNWSVSIGGPDYYQAQEVYVPPQVVYEQPQPVYVERARVVEYYQPNEFRERYWRERKWREQQWRERREHRRHHDDDDDDQ